MTRAREQERRYCLAFLKEHREMWRSIHVGTQLPEDLKQIERFDRCINHLETEAATEA